MNTSTGQADDNRKDKPNIDNDYDDKIDVNENKNYQPNQNNNANITLVSKKIILLST